MQNPFVYGEVVPLSAFVDRETELDRLTGDLLAGQKIFLTPVASGRHPRRRAYR
jgi:hypothetical protein